MSVTVRRRLISRRTEDSDSSEDDLIIELSDEESIEFDTSSEEDVPEVKETVNHYWEENKRATGSSWADDFEEEKPKREQGKHRKKSSNYQKKNTDDHLLNSRWTHDLYESEDDSKKSKRSNRNKARKQTRDSQILKKKDASNEFPRVRKVVEVDLSPDTKAKTNLNADLKKLSVTEMKPTAPETSNTPRVRRGISQAAKNQLIASFTRNPPLKPVFIPMDRTSSTPSPVPKIIPVAVENSKPPIQLLPSDLSKEFQREYKREHSRDLTDKRKSRKPNSNNGSVDSVSNNSNRRSSIASSNFEQRDPEQRGDQLVTTQTGWALYNSSKDNEKNQKKLKNDTRKESRSYKSKKNVHPMSSQLASNTYSQPVQPMINVQPMMTESGHVVLMTEDGLCVPATQEMFQYQQWYDSNVLHDQNSQNYYYQQYYEKSEHTGKIDTSKNN